VQYRGFLFLDLLSPLSQSENAENPAMGYRKLSLTEVRRLFLISLGIGVIAGIYYLISPYQQCKREVRIQ
tara:strand:- start:2037 stop:2246 length:210 start_codon:yes stop_codon:yes gene_type:complete